MNTNSGPQQQYTALSQMQPESPSIGMQQYAFQQMSPIQNQNSCFIPNHLLSENSSLMPSTFSNNNSYIGSGFEGLLQSQHSQQHLHAQQQQQHQPQNIFTNKQAMMPPSPQLQIHHAGMSLSSQRGSYSASQQTDHLSQTTHTNPSRYLNDHPSSVGHNVSQPSLPSPHSTQNHLSNNAFDSGNVTNAPSLNLADKEGEIDRYLQYKTNLCRAFEMGQRCHYGQGCLFAHGSAELRTIEMNVADGIRSHRDVIMFRVKKTPHASDNMSDLSFGALVNPDHHRTHNPNHSSEPSSFHQLMALTPTGLATVSGAGNAVTSDCHAPEGATLLTKEQLAEKSKCLLFKTNLCRSFGEVCPFGTDCLFAHNESELRTVEMNVADKLFTHRDLQAFKILHGMDSGTAISHGPIGSNLNRTVPKLSPMSTAVNVTSAAGGELALPSSRDAFGSNTDIGAFMAHSHQNSNTNNHMSLSPPPVLMQPQLMMAAGSRQHSGGAPPGSPNVHHHLHHHLCSPEFEFGSPLSASSAPHGTPLTQMNLILTGQEGGAPCTAIFAQPSGAIGTTTTNGGGIASGDFGKIVNSPPDIGSQRETIVDNSHQTSSTQQQQHDKSFIQFRTNHCRSFRKGEVCPYGLKCFFAHGDAELRTVAMNMADGLYSKQAVDAFRSRVLQQQASKAAGGARGHIALQPLDQNPHSHFTTNVSQLLQQPQHQQLHTQLLQQRQDPPLMPPSQNQQHPMLMWANKNGNRPQPQPIHQTVHQQQQQQQQQHQFPGLMSQQHSAIHQQQQHQHRQLLPQVHHQPQQQQQQQQQQQVPYMVFTPEQLLQVQQQQRATLSVGHPHQPFGNNSNNNNNNNNNNNSGPIINTNDFLHHTQFNPNQISVPMSLMQQLPLRNPQHQQIGLQFQQHPQQNIRH